jgi:hypothetical protein
VDLVRHYSNRQDLLVDLQHTIRNLQRALADPADASVSVRPQPNPEAGPPSTGERPPHGGADINALVADFQDGTAAWKLAERYRVGLSTVKGILRDRKARPSDVLGRGSSAGSGPGRRMSRMVAEIVRACEDGRLPERFGLRTFAKRAPAGQRAPTALSFLIIALAIPAAARRTSCGNRMGGTASCDFPEGGVSA